MFGLRVPTPAGWLPVVMADFDTFLLDHAANERKASAMAMHLVSHYPDRQELVAAMVDLACEELEHFRLVYGQIAARGLRIAPDTRDAYVRALQGHCRKGTEPYFMDRLLVAGIVEARGCERFGLVAAALPEGPLKALYDDFTRSEARHHALFGRLARTYFDDAAVEARVAQLLDREAEIVAELPLRPALH